MVDCADHERLAEAKVELDVSQSCWFSPVHDVQLRSLLMYIRNPFCLQALMTDETISNVPVLILGNKIDRPEAVSEDGLRGMFGLHGQTTGKVIHTRAFQ